MRQLLLCVVTFSSLFGCTTTSAVGRAVSASELDLDQAESVVEAYKHRRELRHAEVASDPLGKPKSLDDVLEILRRDQIDFFPEALKFASTQEGAQALSLRAQIELAWGEADLILDQMLDRATTRLREQATQLELKRNAGALSTNDEAQLKKIEKTLKDIDGLGNALVRVGGQHIASGAELSKQVIAQSPSDYHGYRVAADYYRIRGDWESFDSMMQKLESANPNSNGLLFLKGMEALQRKNDRAAADAFFTQALERDSKFARARAQLVMAQTDLVAAHDQLEKLKAISPHHQLVRWVGPAIDAYYEWWDVKSRMNQDNRTNQLLQMGDQKLTPKGQ